MIKVKKRSRYKGVLHGTAVKTRETGVNASEGEKRLSDEEIWELSRKVTECRAEERQHKYWQMKAKKEGNQRDWWVESNLRQRAAAKARRALRRIQKELEMRNEVDDNV